MSFDVSKHTGLGYGESIPIIESSVAGPDIANYCDRTRGQFTTLARQWNATLNTEWFARHYLALKMILASSVMMSSCRYAEKKNLRIVEPYLLYYATLSCCRAVVFTLPEQRWDDRLYALTHSKTINVGVDAIKQLSKTLSAEVEATARTALEQREMFSYKFPAEGIPRLAAPADWPSVQRICRLLGEVAQLRTEILHAAVEKHAGPLPALDMEALKKCFEYPGLSGTVVDEDDLHRVFFWKRQMAGPFNLNLLATEGLVEDYFGSWEPDDGIESTADVYSPDWRVIFPFN